MSVLYWMAGWAAVGGIGGFTCVGMAMANFWHGAFSGGAIKPNPFSAELGVMGAIVFGLIGLVIGLVIGVIRNR